MWTGRACARGGSLGPHALQKKRQEEREGARERGAILPPMLIRRSKQRRPWGPAEEEEMGREKENEQVEFWVCFLRLKACKVLGLGDPGLESGIHKVVVKTKLSNTKQAFEAMPCRSCRYCPHWSPHSCTCLVTTRNFSTPMLGETLLVQLVMKRLSPHSHLEGGCDHERSNWTSSSRANISDFFPLVLV